MMEKLIAAAKKVYKADPYDPARKTNNVWARRAIFSVIYPGKYSLQQIGGWFDTCHASIIHSLRKHTAYLETDHDYRKKYNLFLYELGYDVTIEPDPELAINVKIPERNVVKSEKLHRFTQLLSTAPESKLDDIYVRLEAIVKMSKVRHLVK